MPTLFTFANISWKNLPRTLGDKSTNAETCRRVNTNFPIAGMDAISRATNNNPNFRFIYFSGMIAVRDKDASTWIMGDLRKIRVRFLS